MIADKAYSSRAHRAELRRRGIRTVIPEQTTQTAHRRRRGSQGGRPLDYDRELYWHRNVIERGFNTFKRWRGLASRYDNGNAGQTSNPTPTPTNS